jgi:hypothetical protein
MSVDTRRPWAYVFCGKVMLPLGIPCKTEESIVTRFVKYFTLLVFSLTCTVMCSAQTKAVGGGLDCNGFSPISKNVKPYI